MLTIKQKQAYLHVVNVIAPLLGLDTQNISEPDSDTITRIQQNGYELKLAICIALWGEESVAHSIVRLVNNGMRVQELRQKTKLFDTYKLFRNLNLQEKLRRNIPTEMSTGHGPLFELRKRLINPSTGIVPATQKQMAKIGVCSKETIVKCEARGIWPSDPIKERMITYALSQGVNIEDLVDKNELEKMRQWEFEIDGGKYFLEGKAYWPDYVTLSVPRKRALLLIEELTRQLQQNEGDDMLTIYQFGHLFRSTDD
jgi:hypothetical protein